MQKRLLATVVALAAVASARGRAWAEAEDDLREGDRYFEDGDLKHAAASYDNAIRKWPGQVPPEAYGKRAAIYIIQAQADSQNHDQQVKDFQAGLTFLKDVAEKQYPNAPEVLEQEANILWALDKKPEAVAVAEKVVAAKATVYSNQKIIGDFYAGRDATKTSVAFEAYIAARPVEIEEQDVLPRIKLGFAYLTLARDFAHDAKTKEMNAAYDKAVTQFETVEKKFPKKPHAMTNAENGLCAAYAGEGHFDRAITVCERIIQDPTKIDQNGSVWYNLGASYLANKQPKRARTAANEYVRLRKGEARGYILIGDSYFDERDWQNALTYYLQAEKLLKPGDQRTQIMLSIDLGKTYRRLPKPDVKTAIAKLKTGMEANPNSVEIAVELSGAYLEDKNDGEALKLADRMVAQKEFAAASEDQRADLLEVSAKALYNQGKLKESRDRFTQASGLKPKDVQLRRGLVETINRQALDALDKNNRQVAEGLFNEALKVDAGSPMTQRNLAVLDIEGGDCDAAQKHLDKLKDEKGYTLSYERLTARTFLCGKARDPKQAAAHYAAADAEARKVQANLVEAEIYTEWAPLTWDQDLDGAVDKLQTAVQFAAQEPSISAAAKRNLAIALFKRGWRLLKEGKADAAASDFERADREPALLKGTEPLAFEFSLALATLDKGDAATAASQFKQLSAKGNQASYLKPPYAKIGAQFFGAYANYRSNNPSARSQAAAEFQSMAASATGSFAQKVKDLAASAYEMEAADAIRGGRTSAAMAAIKSAQKYASGEALKRLKLDELVATNTGDVKELEAMGESPPQALVDLGILYDRLGRPKDAYDAWVKAQKRGAGGPVLQKWIDAKKRIYGY
jgi:lipopolysaccharide biosynthesis regulator YciM